MTFSPARMLTGTTAVLGFLLSFAASAQSLTLAASDASPLSVPARQATHGLIQASDAPHLDVSSITLPLVLIKGYPFLEGSINGRKGKLLFDLGAKEALAIDNHTVNIKGGRVLGEGMFGSGQRYQMVMYPAVKSLTLPKGLTFRNLRNIDGNPGLPLEQHITADFIGWIGVGMFDDYIFELDHDKCHVRLLRDDPRSAAVQRALAGRAVLQTVKLGNPDHPNLRTISMTVAGTFVQGQFDTGSHNTIWLDDAQKTALQAAGALRTDASGATTISGVAIEGVAVPPMPIEVTMGPPPFAKSLPQSDVPVLQFGYEFLKSYKTVWDLKRGNLYLIAR